MKQLTTHSQFSPYDFLLNNLYYKLYHQFLDTGIPFISKKIRGQVEDFDTFCQNMSQLACLRKAVTIFETDNEITIGYYVNNCFLSIFNPGDKNLTIDLLSDNSSLVEELSLFLASQFQESKKHQQIHMIAPDEYSEQISLHPMGDVSVSLNRLNYADDVIKKVDFVIQELNSENPLGRMVLIDGDPGTGKSFMIRGILKELNFGTCVLIPSSMLDSLDKPTLIPLLMKNKRSSSAELTKKGQIQSSSVVLIIEDADSVLVPRAADNMSAISSLLNYTDGIFGSLFDLRIIATTNASHVEIEPALLRPGRLLKRIHVGLLSPSKAQEIFKSLTGTERKFKKEVSLAEVYSLSKGNETEEQDADVESVMGF